MRLNVRQDGVNNVGVKVAVCLAHPPVKARNESANRVTLWVTVPLVVQYEYVLPRWFSLFGHRDHVTIKVSDSAPVGFI
jgi:hypothetical protein